MVRQLSLVPPSSYGFASSACPARDRSAADLPCALVQLFPLNKYWKKDRVERMLERLGMTGHVDLRKKSYDNTAHLTYLSDEARALALAALASSTDPAAKDIRHSTAAAKKRPSDEPQGGRAAKRGPGAGASEPALTDVRDSVTPWWRVPYAEQLSRKQTAMEAMVKQFAKRAASQSEPPLANLVVPVEPVRASPCTQGYRNKCKFTISRAASGEPCIGYRLGNFAEGNVMVARPTDCSNTPAVAVAIALALERLIQLPALADLKPYELATHTGFWRFAIVRTTETGGRMLVVQVDAAGVESARYEAVQRALVEQFCSAQAPEETRVLSLYIQSFSDLGNEAPPSAPLVHLAGEAVLWESVLGLRFSISPNSFFQVNTPAAEVLYSLVRDWAAADRESIVLDVCCGTGTIGIAVAGAAKHVWGIEMIEAAVADARENAKVNGVVNVTFVADKAEAQIAGILKKYAGQTIVAIVDPPRSGLHPSVSKALRAARNIRRLIYVSCNPKALVDDAERLCSLRPSKAFSSPPFVPVRAAPVDLFPHTDHCELVLCLERADERAADASAAGASVCEGADADADGDDADADAEVDGAAPAPSADE